MRKFLIYIGCFLGTTIINVMLVPFGFKLGIIPMYVLQFCLARYLCNRFDKNTIMIAMRNEAFSKDMTLNQYIHTVVPHVLIRFCEDNKDDPAFIKKNLKLIPMAKTLPKRYLIALLELYK